MKTKDTGLTRFGKQAIAEMNRVGLVVDMSHSADRSTLEAIDHSTRPDCDYPRKPRLVACGKTQQVPRGSQRAYLCWWHVGLFDLSPPPQRLALHARLKVSAK
jgi:hypothetical protein